MAIQVWDEQTQQYVGAELAKFGPTGTLKEALVWDGTQYVKVWPSGPYPMGGEWTGTNIGFDSVAVFIHTIEESGTYTITATCPWPRHNSWVIYLRDYPSTVNWAAMSGYNNPGVDEISTTQTLAEGDQFCVTVQQAGGGTIPEISGTWSIAPA